MISRGCRHASRRARLPIVRDFVRCREAPERLPIRALSGSEAAMEMPSARQRHARKKKKKKKKKKNMPPAAVRQQRARRTEYYADLVKRVVRPSPLSHAESACALPP